MFGKGKERIKRCVENTGILKLTIPKTHTSNIRILTNLHTQLLFLNHDRALSAERKNDHT